MSTFKQASIATPQYSYTANGAVTQATSGHPVLDFFFLAGASRGKDVIPAFSAAYGFDKNLALRVALWMRDARGGAGERESFRKIFKHLCDTYQEDEIKSLIPLVPVVGRWDDLLVVKRNDIKELIHTALKNGEALCAKWMPRQGDMANFLRGDLTPRQWRKLVVGLSTTVEQQMCAKKWDDIVFKHVPSIAAARYQKAFTRNCKHYEEYKKALVKGETKINASVIYPHDVIKAYRNGDEVVSQAQWDSLPNYMGQNARVLPMVDVSGSMDTESNPNPIDVALALGIYCSDKMTGAFKDLVLTFSAKSEIYHIPGDLGAKLSALMKMSWGMNTNIQAAFQRILDVALKNKVPESEMPKVLLILSDMEFDSCGGNTNYSEFKSKYKQYGYDLPRIVFWNLNGRMGNMPVRAHKTGAALVSGFSPAIMTSILSGKEFTPMDIMMDTIMKDRYNF